jgi:hypothetical protein
MRRTVKCGFVRLLEPGRKRRGHSSAAWLWLAVVALVILVVVFALLRYH